VRGQRPKPLDDGALRYKFITNLIPNQIKKSL
jgi:hypothetical protein